MQRRASDRQGGGGLPCPPDKAAQLRAEGRRVVLIRVAVGQKCTHNPSVQCILSGAEDGLAVIPEYGAAPRIVPLDIYIQRQFVRRCFSILCIM